MLIKFTYGSGTDKGLETGICGPKTRLFFSVDTEIYKIRLWKGMLSAQVAPSGEPGGEASLLGTLREW